MPRAGLSDRVSVVSGETRVSAGGPAGQGKPRRRVKIPGILSCQQVCRFINLYSLSEKGGDCQALIPGRGRGVEAACGSECRLASKAAGDPVGDG